MAWCFNSRTSVATMLINGFIFSQFNTLWPRQNGRHFTDDMFKCIFFNGGMWISINISLKFVRKGQINSTPSLVQIMAWCRPGNKPLSEPMMESSLTHISVTRPQWVKQSVWYMFNSLTLGRCSCNLKFVIFKHISKANTLSISSQTVLRWMPHMKTSLMICPHWFRQGLGAIRQQAINWTNDGQVLWCHMTSPGHNELTSFQSYSSPLDDCFYQEIAFQNFCNKSTILFMPQWVNTIQLISCIQKKKTSNGSWCMGIKGEMSGTVCVTFTWYMYIYELFIAFVCFGVCSLL